MCKLKYLLIYWIAFLFLMVIFMLKSGHSCRFEYIQVKEIDKYLVRKTNFVIGSNIERCTFNIADNVKRFVRHKDDSDKINTLHIESGESMPSCKAIHSTAIIVPIKNRRSQLEEFIPYIHDFLKNQKIHYRIFVVEQTGNEPFNKGKLYNIGAKIAMNLNFPCLVLHDVDLLPQNQANIYACTTFPRHMSASIDKFRYNLPYCSLVGGVLSILTDQYLQINGFSNKFENRGGEDDELFQRIDNENLRVLRFSPEISEYTMMKHQQEQKNDNRKQILSENNNKHLVDGLSTVTYKRIKLLNEKMYTNVTVQL